MNNLILNNDKVNKILNIIQSRIETNEFNNNLKKMQEIDSKYFRKKISIKEIINIIEFYRSLETYDLNKESYIAILEGNPNEVFSLILEAIRYNINLKIYIENFCVGQDKLLIQEINNLIKGLIDINITIENQMSDEQIIEQSINVKKVIFIGTSYKYENLKEKIKNSVFYPFNVVDIYFETDKYDELLNKLYDYTSLNGYQIDIYEDLDFEDALNLMNRDSYKFISLILTDNTEHIEFFLKNNQSQYVYANTNPFNKIKFELDINIMK